MKVVINRCFGGFGLSKCAFERLIELGMTVTRHTENGDYENKCANICLNDRTNRISELMREIVGHGYSFIGPDDAIVLRSDPRLVQVVEEYGTKANGPHASLGVVDVPDGVDISIEEYDGKEHISENHRTWC